MIRKELADATMAPRVVEIRGSLLVILELLARAFLVT
jgi:hypothetical protein